MKYFQISPKQVADSLGSDLLMGLRFSQVTQKRELFGFNSVFNHKRTSFWVRFLSLLKELASIILFLAAFVSVIVSFVQQDYFSILTTLLVVVLWVVNCAARTLKEIAVERSLSACEFHVQTVKTMRAGEKICVPAEELVPGDIIYLSSGDAVPADARIVESELLRIDESSISENGFSVEKHDAVILGDNHEIKELENMLFAGSYVLSGDCKAIVTAIGSDTYIQKVSEMSGFSERKKTPLQVQVSQMSKVFGLLSLIICLIIFVLGLICGKAFDDMLLLAATIYATAVPIVAAPLISLALFFGIQKLSDGHVSVQNLKSVEFLSCVDVLCVDKSGLLTQNSMSVEKLYVHGAELEFQPENYREVAEVLLYGSMCNDAGFIMKDGKRVMSGDPTEGAILLALEKLGMQKEMLDVRYPGMGSIPFDGNRKCKSSIHVIDGRNLVIVKGAPDTVLSKCVGADLENTREAGDRLASKGLRVLAVAVKEIDSIPPKLFANEIENDLTLIGLIGLNDPQRSETGDALAVCKSAGIRTVMFTGDHSLTAKSMAENIGILRGGDVIDGDDMLQLSENELLDRISRCNVYSRLNSAQKERIVRLLQKKGYVVAITGDDVSDVLSLKASDVGCALHRGKDITKKTADLILQDDSFEGLVSAIRIGRGIYNNVCNAISYLLTANVSAALVIILLLLISTGMPMMPLWFLWLNVLILALLSMSLCAEKPNHNLMKHRPRNKKTGLFSKKNLITTAWQSASIVVICVVAYLIGVDFAFAELDEVSTAVGNTMAFTTLAFALIVQAFSARSKASVLKIGIFSNMTLNIGALIALFLLLFVLLVPGVMTFFGLSAMQFGEWICVILLGLIPAVINEVTKLFSK